MAHSLFGLVPGEELLNSVVTHHTHVVRSLYTFELWYKMMYETQYIRQHIPHWWVLNSGSQSV